jgi:hypothetical protein
LDEPKKLGVLKMARVIYFYAIMIYNPVEKSGRSFCSEVFSQKDEGKIKTKMYLRMVKTISLEMHRESLYMNTNLGLQTFKLLFFKHYKKIVEAWSI